MDDYTANDLERHVLDPLFYRYERSIRAQVRLEREVAAVTQDRNQLRAVESAVTDLHRRNAMQEATIARLQAEARLLAPKVKALYDNSKDLLVDMKVARVRRGTRDIIRRIEKALNDLYPDVEIPF